jgi:GAF domain-containing protein
MSSDSLYDRLDAEASFATDIIKSLYQNANREELVDLQRRVEESAWTPAQKSKLLDAVAMALKLSERFNEYQQRERGLNAVIENAQDLTAVRDIDQALQAVVRRARKLMGTDVGYLSIYDHQHGDFYVRATDGTFSDKFKKIRVGSGTGVCGYVATNKCPYSSVEYDQDPRFSHTNLIDTAVIEEGIKCILGVPLLSGDTVLGVLFVGDRYVRPYSTWEMSILSTLAAHASVAIENARLFEQTQTALKQINDANVLLKRHSEIPHFAAQPPP